MPTHTATEAHACVDIKMGAPGTPAGTPSKTVMQTFQACCAKNGNMPALRQKKWKQGMSEAEREALPWDTYTWNQYHGAVRSFAKSLISMDFAPFASVNIIGFNSPEWNIADIGTIAAGGIAAGIYTTNLPEACAYISEHSECEVVVLEDTKQLAKYVKIAHMLPRLKAVVVWGDTVNLAAFPLPNGVKLYSWSDFLGLGAAVPDAALDGRIADQKPGNCCTLIYTSGTTGPPKGVMISHDNCTWTSDHTPYFFGEITNKDRVVSYLPLSHIAAQLLDIHIPMMAGATVYFAQPDALKGSITKTLNDAKPTLFFGVPRVWEKIYEKMQEKAGETKGLKKSVAAWAKGNGTAKNAAAQFGSDTKSAPCGFGCANSLVLSKIKAVLGLDKARGCFTGAAPISPTILTYFASLDIPIYELFGQSECTGPHTMNCSRAWKIGTCGRPLPGTRTKIDPETGEICYSGRHIFMGYLKMKEKTEETVDADGWLHSGDVGKLDDDDDPNVEAPSGFLSITGRIKELIITAGGENIPPVIIEEEFKKALPCVSNCMVIGDKRKFLSILLTLKVDVDMDTQKPTCNLTKQCLAESAKIGSSAKTVQEAKACDKWQAHLNAGCKVANGNSTSRAQIVQKFTLLEEDFSEAGGHLTPTLKLKRSVVATMLADEIDAMYN